MNTRISHLLTPKGTPRIGVPVPQRVTDSGVIPNLPVHLIFQYWSYCLSHLPQDISQNLYELTPSQPSFQTFSQMNLANHRRKNMTVLQMEIIIRTIKVGRHHGNIVRTILKIEAFTSSNPQSWLRFYSYIPKEKSVRSSFIGLCGITRIDTGTTQEKQFLYVMTEALPITSAESEDSDR